MARQRKGRAARITDDQLEHLQLLLDQLKAAQVTAKQRTDASNAADQAVASAGAQKDAAEAAAAQARLDEDAADEAVARAAAEMRSYLDEITAEAAP